MTDAASTVARLSGPPHLPWSQPVLGEEEIAEVVDTLRSGWLTTGPKTHRFEEEFARFVGARHALAVNSATAGLHLALDAIGLRPDDIVLTTPYTFGHGRGRALLRRPPVICGYLLRHHDPGPREAGAGPCGA